MDGEAAKGLSIVILFLLTVLFGWLPVWLHHRGSLSATASPRRKLVLDIFNCFAGGVFLGTCLLHLLAEGMEDFDHYKDLVSFDSDFPFYHTVAGVGVFLVALVDKVGLALMNSKTETKTSLSRKSEERSSPRVAYSKARAGHPSYGATQTTGDGPVGNLVLSDDDSGSDDKAGSRLRVGSPPQDTASRNCTDGESAAHIEHSQQHQQRCQPSPSPSSHHASVSQVSTMRALLLLVALSFHTVFDGLAVGLQDTPSQVWQVLTAIAIHKSLVAFCLGLELSVSNPGKPIRPLACLFLFALISPVGIGIGMGVTSSHVDQEAQLLVSSILQALASGTFLYVTFLEILGPHLGHSYTGTVPPFCQEVAKVAVAVLGFACMAGVKLLDKD